MWEVWVLAVALSMDAFAVSLGLGVRRDASYPFLGLRAGLYFGAFQGLMPLLGYLAGRGVLGWVEAYAPWVAAALLFAIGGKMLYESQVEGIEEGIARITHRLMLTLAIATSIDAMAAGFSLILLPVSAWLACVIIALVTFGFSWLGVTIGRRGATWLESKAEMLGGVVLILIGVRILLA